MPKAFYKHKLLLDEGFLLRQRLPILNSRFDVEHLTADLGFSGVSDRWVYDYANKLGRLVVTFNDRDFRDLAGLHDGTGVIGVSANLSAEQIDKKLTALLMKASGSGLLRKFTYVSGESR